MREQFDGKHKEEIKSDEQIKEEAIEALQKAIEEEVSEEELEKATEAGQAREEQGK